MFVIQQVRLDNQSGPRFAVSALQGNGDDIAPLQATQPEGIGSGLSGLVLGSAGVGFAITDQAGLTMVLVREAWDALVGNPDPNRAQTRGARCSVAANRP